MKRTWNCATLCAACAVGAAIPAQQGPSPKPAPLPTSRAQDLQEPAHNRLTPDEEAAGWRLLFDGATLSGWRGYRMDGVPRGWSATEGALAFAPPERDDAQRQTLAADLITVDTFDDFELSLEWKVGPSGNSGVFYRLTEAERAPYWTGPEMQVLDNAGHADGRTPKTSAGANYGLHAPAEDVARPAGEWNRARIVVRGSRVEHWLNGSRIVSYELGSESWRGLVAASKFGEWPGYGMARSGHVGLQDHGDPVWFRNVKIRESASRAPPTAPRPLAATPRSLAKKGAATLPS